MISVKDKDVALRRTAFLQTIQHHKSQASNHQGHVFSSTVNRFGSEKKDLELSLIREQSQLQYEKDL